MVMRRVLPPPREGAGILSQEKRGIAIVLVGSTQFDSKTSKSSALFFSNAEISHESGRMQELAF
jgi:hypothetical protein